LEFEGFLSKNPLDTHKIVHSGKRQFNCEICGSTFFYKNYLNVQMRDSHPTGLDMPGFKCEVCGSKFRLKESLLRHVKSLTCFQCDVCGKTLTSRTSLEGHDVCGKMFAKSSSLHLHLQTHTGELPHSCVHCGKKFMQLSSFSVHKCYISGIRPYQCNICCKDFVTKTLT
jgi:KRAB domain-containing zinc finger protein